MTITTNNAKSMEVTNRVRAEQEAPRNTLFLGDALHITAVASKESRSIGALCFAMATPLLSSEGQSAPGVVLTCATQKYCASFRAAGQLDTEELIPVEAFPKPKARKEGRLAFNGSEWVNSDNVHTIIDQDPGRFPPIENVYEHVPTGARGLTLSIDNLRKLLDAAKSCDRVTFILDPKEKNGVEPDIGKAQLVFSAGEERKGIGIVMGITGDKNTTVFRDASHYYDSSVMALREARARLVADKRDHSSVQKARRRVAAAHWLSVE